MSIEVQCPICREFSAYAGRGPWSCANCLPPSPVADATESAARQAMFLRCPICNLRAPYSDSGFWCCPNCTVEVRRSDRIAPAGSESSEGGSVWDRLLATLPLRERERAERTGVIDTRTIDQIRDADWEQESKGLLVEDILDDVYAACGIDHDDLAHRVFARLGPGGVRLAVIKDQLLNDDQVLRAVCVVCQELIASVAHLRPQGVRFIHHLELKVTGRPCETVETEES